MNYKMTVYILGQIALFMAAFMLIPFLIALFGEMQTTAPLAFGVTIAILAVVGGLLVLFKPKDTSFNVRGGFLIVALAWIGCSLFGSLPFFISGAIPSFVDCIFETVSGFTTTGATILQDVEALPNSLLFWRSFTHWFGGMGVLLFVIAILPKGDPSIVHILKAETPGPKFGKIVSKMHFTARILYAIYIVLTIVEAILLICGGMSVFDSFIHALGTAGTGGFSNYSTSVGHFDSLYVEVVITVFMMIFSVNFNLFFLVLIGHAKEAIRSEELWWFLSIFAVASFAIALSLSANSVYENIWQSLRYSTFQVASSMSTTGYMTADFATWPMFAQMVLILLMFVGGCAGSTAGGSKISRIMILIKSAMRTVKKEVSPRSVVAVKVDKRPVAEELVSSVKNYYSIYILLMGVSILLLSIFTPANFDFTTNTTAVITCFNNVGPGLGGVGPALNFSQYGGIAKMILVLDMLMGRLEIIPMIMLFYPKAWRRAK